MKIMIDIPETEYNALLQLKETNPAYFSLHPMDKIVLDGIPLPKGHGRLIDADVFENRLMDARAYYIGEKADDFDLRFAAGLQSAAERLVDAPTIIEADERVG